MEEIDLDFNGMDVSQIDVRLKHLYYFIVVAETGNITRAAQKLYVTQPMLSKNMIALEETIGIPLFDRCDRNFTLTKTGRYLYTHWKKLINIYRRDMDQARLMQHTSIDKLRVGCFPVLDTHRFLKLYLDRLNAGYPNLFVELYRMNYIRLLEHLNARKIDVMFTLWDDLPENKEFYEWEQLKTLPLAAVMPQTHPLSQKSKLRFSMLSGQPLILNEPEGNLSRTSSVQRMLDRYGMQSELVRFVNNDLTAYLCAEQGTGIAIGIRDLYPEQNDGVCILDIEDTETPVVAVWNRDAAPEMKRLLHDFLS